MKLKKHKKMTPDYRNSELK